MFSEHTTGILLGIYALVLWALVFLVFRKGYHEWRTNRANRLYKYPAKVLDRREVWVRPEDLNAEPVLEQYVLFDIEGRQQEFKVEPEIYAVARVGQEGMIYTKGGKFETFEPMSPGERAESLYRRVVGR